MQSRYNLLEEFYLLVREFSQTDKSSHVSARPREALYVSIRDGIRCVKKYNRYLRDNGFGGPNRLILEGDNKIHLVANELLGRLLRRVVIWKVPPVDYY